MLAPDLFCRAILCDYVESGVRYLWIRVGPVGPNVFDDLDYAEHGTLLPCDRTLTAALLERFDEEAGHLGLHVS